MSISPRKLSVSLLCLLAAGSLAAVTGCAAATEAASSADEPTADTETGKTSEELRIRGGLGADGDACTVRTNPDGTTVPGTEKGLECCSTADPNDCVIILKPFPSFSYSLTP